MYILTSFIQVCKMNILNEGTGMHNLLHTIFSYQVLEESHSLNISLHSILKGGCHEKIKKKIFFLPHIILSRA